MNLGINALSLIALLSVSTASIAEPNHTRPYPPTTRPPAIGKPVFRNPPPSSYPIEKQYEEALPKEPEDAPFHIAGYIAFSACALLFLRRTPAYYANLTD